MFPAFHLLELGLPVRADKSGLAAETASTVPFEETTCCEDEGGWELMCANLFYVHKQHLFNRLNAFPDGNDDAEFGKDGCKGLDAP